MSETRKANVEEATYFFTITVVGWIDVFTRKDYVDELFASITYCQQHKGLEVFAYCLMPSHLHMIARRGSGKLADVLRDMKSYSAMRILKLVQELPNESRRDWLLHMFRYHAKYQPQNKEFMFWQKTSHPIHLWTSEVFDQKVAHIHHNPVAAGYVSDPAHYLLSSAHPSGPLQLVDYNKEAEPLA